MNALIVEPLEEAILMRSVAVGKASLCAFPVAGMVTKTILGSRNGLT